MPYNGEQVTCYFGDLSLKCNYANKRKAGMIKIQISQITLPARRARLDQRVTMTDRKTIKACETIGHGVIHHPGIHRMTLWGFVPQSRPTVLDKSCTAPGRGGGIDSFCTKLDRKNYGSMDIRHCKKWNKLQFAKLPKESGPKETIFISQEKKLCILDEVGKLLGKKCYRTCTPRPGRSGLLQHLFCRSEERRRLASNTKSSTAEHASHNSTFQDGNSEVNNEVFSARGLGIFGVRYGDLTKQYEVPLSRMLHDILDDDHMQ